jgi:hypothetical protein
MDFAMWCPDDGTVRVGLEDIDSIVVRSRSDVEVVFVCPKCGRKVTMNAELPQALLASLDDSWFSEEGVEAPVIKLRMNGESAPRAVADEAAAPTASPLVDDPRIDSYCEFFRRELDDITSAEDMLSQMGHESS